MSMLSQIALGVGVNLLTIVAVVVMLEFAGFCLSGNFVEILSNRAYVRAGVITAALVIWVLCALSVAIWAWALMFALLDLFPNIEESMYFSLATFTTLGFGDVLSPQSWRIFCGMAAVNGLLLFGLVTAFLIQQIQRHHLLSPT